MEGFQSVQAFDPFTDGVLKPETAQSGAGGGNLYAEITPPQGTIWTVVAGMGYHDDDGGARVAYWSYWDGASDTRLDGTASLLLNVFQQFFSQVPSGRPWVLAYGTSLRFHVDGLVAGHLAKANFVMAEVRGMEPWSNV